MPTEGGFTPKQPGSQTNRREDVSSHPADTVRPAFKPLEREERERVIQAIKELAEAVRPVVREIWRNMGWGDEKNMAFEPSSRLITLLISHPSFEAIEEWLGPLQKGADLRQIHTAWSEAKRRAIADPRVKTAFEKF